MILSDIRRSFQVVWKFRCLYLTEWPLSSRAVWHGFKKPRFFLKNLKSPNLDFKKNKNLMSDLSFFSSSIYLFQIGQFSTLYK